MNFARHLLAAVVAGSALGCANAQQPLPPEIDSALARARLPREAISVLVVDADGAAGARISHRSRIAVNPASIMKLVTTYAALDKLGAAFTWNTPVSVDGPIANGILRGNLYIQGQGDPKLVVERLWLLMRRVQGLGVRQIAGDIVLDRSAFDVAEQDPGAFDGEPFKPYNAAPDALLLNFKALVMSFVPDRSGRRALVSAEPALAGVEVQAEVQLSDADCGDWRGGLQADFSDPRRIRFAGAYPASCGERSWPVAYADPPSYAARAIEAAWKNIGGQLAGQVREGRVPRNARRLIEFASPPLAEVVRDINKYSNNVMAQQLFLTLDLRSRPPGLPATLAGARTVVGNWWKEQFGSEDTPVLDNGSGLSRGERISAQALGRLLQAAWQSPLMPELVGSLPVTGVDGTLRRSKAKLAGAAHLKTGSLRDVVGIAGYVDGASGKRYVLVAIANHPNAAAARPVLDALIDWTGRDQ